MGSFWCKNFSIATRGHWKASFTEIYLIKNEVFIQVYFMALVKKVKPNIKTGLISLIN
jgi:hypothetical protein